MMDKTCINCSTLAGCHLLADSKNHFVPERAITEARSGECSYWTPVNPKQQAVRSTMFGLLGIGCLRVIHEAAPASIDDQLIEIHQKEEDALMSEDMPDFDEPPYLIEGMSAEDREAVLLYELNERGELLVEEDGRHRPRPSWQLRKFACDQDKHIQLDHATGMFWRTDQIVKHILAVEVEQGLLEKAKRKTKKQEQVKEAAEPAKKEENTKMAKRTIVRNRPGAKPAAAGAKKPMPGKVSGGAKGPAKAAKGKKAADEADDDAPQGLPPAAMPFDMDDLIEKVVANVIKHVNQRLGEMEGRIESLHSETREQVANQFAIMHDIAASTSGTFGEVDDEGNVTPYDEVFSLPGQLLGAYLGDGQEEEEGNEEDE